jgi:hypothetical protein
MSYPFGVVGGERAPTKSNCTKPHLRDDSHYLVEIMISRQDGLAALALYSTDLLSSYHHHIPAGTIAGINGVNSGFGNDDIQTGWAFNN